MADTFPFARVLRVARTGSTNSDLRAAAATDPGAWPHLSVLVTDQQDAGRGRAGRTWVTAPGTALTASVLLRPRVPAERLAWVTLLGGLAVQRATAELAGVRTGIKWPNDVLVVGAGDEDVPGWGRDRKVAGILAEVLLPAGGAEGAVVAHEAGMAARSDAGAASGAFASADTGAASGAPASAHASAHASADADTRDHLPAVVLGIGVNVRQSPEELPVDWATSLALAARATGGATVGAGATGGPAEGDTAPSVDDTLAAVGAHLADLLARWERAGGDAEAAGLADEVRAACLTMGRPVRAELPGGAVVAGTATDIDGAGRLLVRTDAGEVTTVQAGDVLHVRADI
ncbi:biotin--[acetyl-CoA-carboxylase] ligase [Georgenia sp. SYP-B2076]|uniref:biotin--[acetyl-CoA-carboxylase] ligase n=1 Tax=Georgenia sp. SYP-B2076 TaxID=2495881 RepID=UPI000F8E3D96|nr:biotin--[acetyl-CoA-carboxylase] ligase [Georgenia sp. SYP-B2076]